MIEWNKKCTGFTMTGILLCLNSRLCFFCVYLREVILLEILKVLYKYLGKSIVTTVKCAVNEIFMMLTLVI